MSKQEILERIQNVLNQGVDTESQDLDLLRHDLENDIISEDKKEKCEENPNQLNLFEPNDVY
jgi:hypothetical protein